MTRRHYRDSAHLEEMLRERPTGHAEPTLEDRYHDGNTYDEDADTVPPWLDLSDDREAEL